MGWLNEFDWFVLLLLIMKLAILWAVAACVAALDLPCEEYCTCLSSGFRDVEYQPGCDCMYEERDLEKLDDSGIYYEPAAYVSLPAYIYNHPFYIINPILQLRQKNSGNTDVKTINIQPEYSQVPEPRRFNTDIEINIENAHPLHKRKEKDIQTELKKASNALYLDIHIEPEDSERSASENTFTADDLKQTELSLLECADLYTLLTYRKNNDSKHLARGPSQLQKYENLSNRDLIEAIDNKCLYISYIIEKSLNEIKEKRPKKVNSSLTINNRDKENNILLRDKDILKTQQHVDMITEANLQQTVYFSKDNGTVIIDDEENKDHTVVIYIENESEENEVKTHSTLPSQVASTTVPVTLDEGIATLVDRGFQMGVEDVSVVDTGDSTEKYPTITSIYPDNEYPFHAENSLNTESINTFDLSTPAVITKTEQQEFSESRRSNNEFITESDIEKYYENRIKYKEEDVPVAKVITHEFNNDTVQSYINGTEDVSNGDFRDENSDDDNESMIDKIETSDTDKDTMPIDSDIYGNLYFLVNQQQIPARFVQKPNGTLQIGIDAITICNKLKQDGEFVSKLFSVLCKCYESDNCTNLH